jgi:hypothetical protein
MRAPMLSNLQECLQKKMSEKAPERRSEGFCEIGVSV